MTLEMQEMLEREMEDALALEDPDRRHDATLTVLAHQSRALIDCQRKTSDRVKVGLENDKRMSDKIEEIEKKLAPCVESDKEYRQVKSDAKAVKGFLGWCGRYVWPLIKKIIEVAGPTTVAIIFCKMTGILW